MERRRVLEEREMFFSEDAVNTLNPSDLEQREKELKFAANRKMRIAEKFGNYLGFKKYIDEKFPQSQKTNVIVPITIQIASQKQKEIKVNEEIIEPLPDMLTPEGAEDTILDVLNSDKDIEELDLHKDVTISTTHSNAQLINDVLEVRKQVEKFSDLLENSKSLLLNTE
eukprot:CAMPEP_0205812626 /NCGR_PEP_ID=MMETSP0205-20121125/17119_1 /ASSEMBLY_ACC=CAM_ASM_000278 /TAXON_ID=36767 /ORGANISM="Euplotes focardii, Strain TN1" /LENGTH=168 /DNA_ID=CAMNT_0053093571 /DNA_START=476 /DNA_END=982 /DNA_ORIENTATION=+